MTGEVHICGSLALEFIETIHGQ